MATTSNGGPTPPSDTPPSNGYASYVPHDLKYDADYEDSVMQMILEPPSNDGGIRIIPEDSKEQPVDGISVRAKDISSLSLPNIQENDLPLPLTDSRRIFASAVPGIKLTHPGGYLEGGPGLDPDQDTFTNDFLEENKDISSAEELRARQQKEIDVNLEELKKRVEARRKAKEKNDEIEKKLKNLKDQHDMELKVHRKMADEAKAKKEAKEKRKKGKAG